MIEKIILRYLSEVLDAPVFAGEKPTDKNEYIVFRRADESRVDLIDSVSLIFECYSTSLQKSAELYQRLKEAMFDAVSLPEVSSSKLSGGGQNIDTTSKSYCYEAVFNIYYYA